jgi:hypothetical protein
MMMYIIATAIAVELTLVVGLVALLRAAAAEDRKFDRPAQLRGYSAS